MLGVLYEVSKFEIPALDSLESVDTGVYRKDQFLVLGFANRWYTATVYRPTMPRANPLPPAPFYLDHMIDGARAHGLDPQYVERLVELKRSIS